MYASVMCSIATQVAGGTDFDCLSLSIFRKLAVAVKYGKYS